MGSRERILAQYQTDPAVVTACLRFLRKHVPCARRSTHFIEPSAGAGAFYDRLPPKRTLGVDIDRRLRKGHPQYRTTDFLSMTPEDLPWRTQTSDVIVVGNPPFSDNGVKRNRHRGRAVNLALRFLNHATKFADVVALVMPSSMGKLTSQERVEPLFHLEAQLDLRDVTFTYRTKSVEIYNGCFFQIWKRGTRPRVKRAKRMVQGSWRGEWSILQPTDSRANLLVRRWSSPETLGRVVDSAPDIKRAVFEAGRAEKKYRGDARYGPNYRLSRNSRVDFHLHCRQPRQTAAVFRRAKPTFVEYGRFGLPASVTQEDLLRIYLQHKK